MYVLYKVTRDGNRHTVFEAETFEAMWNEVLMCDYHIHTDKGVFYGICNTEPPVNEWVWKESGLTDEEREQLPPGL
jgi:hypothetical protein